mmetsp:Transcript_21377/g.45064  ORF Transcript_21377/g.45064 Transcript_21377/m.45064 type:complete len:341 (-) Transcript_21377:607-1629(-)
MKVGRMCRHSRNILVVDDTGLKLIVQPIGSATQRKPQGAPVSALRGLVAIGSSSSLFFLPRGTVHDLGDFRRTPEQRPGAFSYPVAYPVTDLHGLDVKPNAFPQSRQVQGIRKVLGPLCQQQRLDSIGDGIGRRENVVHRLRWQRKGGNQRLLRVGVPDGIKDGVATAEAQKETDGRPDEHGELRLEGDDLLEWPGERGAPGTTAVRVAFQVDVGRVPCRSRGLDVDPVLVVSGLQRILFQRQQIPADHRAQGVPNEGAFPSPGAKVREGFVEGSIYREDLVGDAFQNFVAVTGSHVEEYVEDDIVSDGPQSWYGAQGHALERFRHVVRRIVHLIVPKDR